MSPSVRFRRARADDAPRLSEIARAAKAHWGYPAAWLETWRSELTFDADTLAREWTWVAEAEGRPVAVTALSGAGLEPELSHLWVEPASMGRGLGRRLLEAATARARRQGARLLRIVADPHAAGFYEAMGAHRVGSVPSRPEGRTLPLMILELR